MKNMVVLLLSLISSNIVYPKEFSIKYPTFDNYEVSNINHAYDKDYFKKGLRNKNLTDTECLTYIIYGEARGEPDDGQIAVAFVVKNRADKQNKSLCEIARQPGEFESSINKLYGEGDRQAWSHALNIAYFLNQQEGYVTVKSPVGDAIYFNSLPADQQYVMGRGRFRGKIGHHYFYGARRNDK